MGKRKVFLFIAAALLAIWVVGVVRDFDKLCKKTPNPEYQNFITQQKQNLQRTVEQLTTGEVIRVDGANLYRSDNCIGSNFEGAEVKLAGIQLYDSIYGSKSVKPYYTYSCNGAILDPDHPLFGLPDIEVLIGPVTYYEPELSGVKALMNFGFSRDPKPHKTFRKALYDSTGKKLQVFEMQLWLTYFKVAISVISNRDKPQITPDDESLNARIYPGKWYCSSKPLISVNDLEQKEEYKNHQYGDITFVLEVNPNASPWYINTGSVHTARPDIAVGAVICKELVKRPEDENMMHLQTQRGMLTPLYFKPFERTVQPEKIDSIAGQVETEIQDYKNFDIWNKPYYARLYSRNIGSRQKGFFGQKKFDEQVEYTFLLPLLVVGSWDVQLPWDVMPEMQAPVPYSRGFNLKNLFPEWGIKSGGWISAGLLVAVVVLLLLWFLPMLRR